MEDRTFTEWLNYLWLEQNPLYKMVKCCSCDVRIRAWQVTCNKCFAESQAEYIRNIQPIIRYI